MDDRISISFPTLILLAAGRSSRMDQPKGLIELDGEFWIARQLKDFEKAGGEKAIVVLGFNQDLYFQKIPELQKAKSQSIHFLGLNLRVAINESPERGQFSSIQCGLRESTRTPGPVFLLPVDVPAPSKEVWQKLLSQHFENSSIVAEKFDVSLPTYNGHGGHPVLIGHAFQNTVVHTDAETGRLDQLIHALNPNRVRRVPVTDPSVTVNLNTPEEWALL